MIRRVVITDLYQRGIQNLLKEEIYNAKLIFPLPDQNTISTAQRTTFICCIPCINDCTSPRNYTKNTFTFYRQKSKRERKSEERERVYRRRERSERKTKRRVFSNFWFRIILQEIWRELIGECEARIWSNGGRSYMMGQS